MTCLIGLIQDGETYLGADGFATTEDCERKPIVCRKIFVSDNYLVAFAGHIRTGQLLYPESGFVFPKDIYQIPNHMFLWLREFDAIGKDDAHMAIIQSNFLIATKDKIYEVLMDMQISELDPECGYTALGSGTPYSLGSLYTTALMDKIPPPKARIELALYSAAEFVKNIGPPYNIYSHSEAMKLLKTKKIKKSKVIKTRTKKKSS
jgi:ATP-dependent protease HslVU (ClpYQ) peptidase subunit